MTDLEGKRILITGGSLGLGRAVGAECARAGASVMLSARTEPALEEARREVSTAAVEGARVLARIADVSDATDVDALVADTEERLGGLDGLVCCAGVYGPIGRFDEVDWDDWIATIQINLFGTLLACRAAVPALRRAGGGKIVTLSGGGATAPLPRFTAYGASKVAVVRMTETLADEIAGDGIEINAVAPGALNTRMLEQVLDAGPELAGGMHERAQQQAESGGASIERAAELCAFLLSAASDGVTGRLISAPWDPWEDLPAKAETLRNSDIYTLRRIVPDDRPDVDWATEER